MRPGPSTEQLAGAVAVGARVSVVRGGRDVLAVDVPVKNVVLDWTASRVVPAKVAYLAPLDMVPTHPLAALANFGQRSQLVQLLEVEGRTVEVELGWFQHAEWAETGDGVQVTCLDLMQALDENPMTWPSSPPAGATILSEVRRLAGGLPVVLDDPVNRAVPRATQWGTSRTEAIRDLAESYGLEYAVKPDGYLHLWAQRDGREPVAHYTARDLLLDAPRTSHPRRANRWTVTGTTGAGEDEQRFSATVAATEPPYDVAGYGTVTDRREMNVATTQSQVTQAAGTYMRKAMVSTSTRSLEIAPDPRLEGGDIISATTQAGESIVGRIVAYSLPVTDPSARMRVDIEELSW